MPMRPPGPAAADSPAGGGGKRDPFRIRRLHRTSRHFAQHCNFATVNMHGLQWYALSTRDYLREVLDWSDKQGIRVLSLTELGNEVPEGRWENIFLE
eukprot:10998983-Alexandrium_andersonii.AAC.1